MNLDISIEALIPRISELDGEDCMVWLRHFSAEVEDEALAELPAQSLEGLRHLLLKTCLRIRRKQRSATLSL